LWRGRQGGRLYRCVQTLLRAFNEIVKSQVQRSGDSHDDGKPRIGALSLLDLGQRLGGDLSLEGELGARQSSLSARLLQDDGHCASQVFAHPDRAAGASWR